MKKICVVFIIITLAKICVAQPSHLIEKNSFEEKLNKNNAIARKIINKEYLNLFDKQYQIFKIFSYCKMGFTQGHSDEFALEVINMVSGELKYILLIHPADHYKILELSNYMLNSGNSMDWTGKDIPGLFCFTKNQLKKEIKNINETSDLASDTSLRAINKFGTVCTGSDFYDYLCYAYSLSRNNIIALGGWLTD